MTVSEQQACLVMVAGLPPAKDGKNEMARRFHGLRTFTSLFFYICLLTILVMLFAGRYLTEMTVIHPQLRAKIRQFSLSRVQSFTEDWRRLNKARVDWQAVLNPCFGNIAWATRTSGFEKEMATSPELSYIKDMSIRPAGEFSKILLRTRTTTGLDKNVGGDFWTVVFKGPSCVYATVFDHGDGTYEAMALLMEPGVYNVEIFLHYTLCDGLRDPPENWVRVGKLTSSPLPQNILASSMLSRLYI